MGLYRIAEESAAESLGRRLPWLFAAVRAARYVVPVGVFVAAGVLAWVAVAAADVSMPAVPGRWILGAVLLAVVVVGVVAAARRWGADAWWRLRFTFRRY